MRKSLGILLTVCWSVLVAQAQDSVPVRHILPEDIAQEAGIQQFRIATNKFIVRWTYTEAGAKKMLAFNSAHAGQAVITKIGSFESPRGLVATNRPPGWSEEGWLKWRTDKVFGVTEDDAKKIVAGLKSK